jgi:hypothetical protein
MEKRDEIVQRGLTRRIPILITLLFSGYLVAGCGAGNVVGTAFGLNEAFDQTSSPTNSVSATPEQLAPIEDPGTTPTDVPSTPVNTGGIPRELTDLFGVGFFTHGFSGDSTIFVIESRFDNQSVFTTSAGDIILATNAAFFSSDDGGETINGPFERVFSCIFIDSAQVYLCINAVNEAGATGNFLLGRLSGGRSDGNFEFCDENTTVEVCVDGLINEPDGGVSLTISTATAALVQSSTEKTVAAHGDSEKLVSTMRYLKQGTVDYNVNNGVTKQRTPLHEIIKSARAELLSPK